MVIREAYLVKHVSSACEIRATRYEERTIHEGTKQ